MTNYLYYGDNLDVLRESIADESVDLVYLDPPFNSNRSYNVLFKNKSGTDAQAQIEAFDDTWTWSHEAEQQYLELVSGGAPAKVADAIEAMRKLLGDNDVLAYLVMMTPRLVELHRVLKLTGSLYLHCDPTASHYLKVMLDAIFGPTNFRNEVIWRRTGSHGKLRRYGPVHDVILFVTKSDNYTWNYPRKPYMRGHVEEYFVQQPDGRWRTNYYGNVLTGSGTRGGESGKPWMGFDPTAKGRHWAIPGALVEAVDEDMSGLSQHEKLDRLYELGHITIEEGAAWPMYQRYITPGDGTPAPDLWAFQPYTKGTVFGTEAGIDEDVRWLNPKDSERLGYPTQKPLALMERIINASSSEGDVILDPFCGCGTTVDAAEKLGRRWIGIDITYISIDLITKRLRDTHGDEVMDDVEVLGLPRDVPGARALFERSPFEFERWAVTRVEGQPNLRQVGDKGVDGVIRFPLDGTGKNIGRVLVSVKGGKAPGPTAVRDLAGTVEAQRAQMGVLVTLEEPTRGMKDAAQHAGLYQWPWNGATFPKIQTMTVGQLLAGQRPDAPPSLLPYVEAKRQLKPAAEQGGLFEV